MKIAVLGCGNMASAIVLQMAKKNKKIEFLTFTPSKTKALELANKVDGQQFDSLNELVEMKDSINYWIIACKPQQLNELSESLGQSFKDQKIISVLAAIDITKLKNKLRTPYVYRVMPNTPSKIGKGISLICHSKELVSADISFLDTSFESIGSVFKLETEKELDELTVLTGSGPGIVFHFARLLSDSYTKLGYDENIIRGLVNQLFIGSSELMNNEKELNLKDLTAQVTSKGGVTIEFLNEMDRQKIPQSLDSALNKALERGKQLAKT